MIAVDTSALVAILLDEPERPTFVRAIREQSPFLVGTPTVLELRMVTYGIGGETLVVEAMELLNTPTFELVPFTAAHLAHAQDAFRRFGKGTGHPARLNFGDCMSYAVAREAGCPLLYKGDDFARTDVAAAL